MLQTPYYPAFISAAGWSPTRAGAASLQRGNSGMLRSDTSDVFIVWFVQLHALHDPTWSTLHSTLCKTKQAERPTTLSSPSLCLSRSPAPSLSLYLSLQVFFLARQDGRLDVWDYFYRMNEASKGIWLGSACFS